MMKRPFTVALIAAIALVGGCSDDGADTASSTTTGAPTTTAVEDSTTVADSSVDTTTTTQLTADRPVADAPAAGQPYEQGTCDALFAGLKAITLPVEGADDFATQLDASVAAVDAASAAAPGYPADQLGILRAALEGARTDIEQDGFAGWQHAIIESRNGPDEQDVEVQLEALRAYVLPRC